MSEPPADEWQPQDVPDLDDTTEADRADVAEQRLPAEPRAASDMGDSESPLPSEAEPADVLEQRQPAPDEDEPKF